MNRITKLATVGLAAVGIAGLAGATATAATAATAHPANLRTATGPHYPNAKTGDIIFFNATPWTESIGQEIDGSNAIARIGPGQSVLIPQAQVASTLTPYAAMEVRYNYGIESYSDVDAVLTHGNAPGVQSCAEGTNGYLSPGLGCIVQTPNVTAGEAGPTQISMWNTEGSRQSDPLNLDANAADADPTAMGNFLSGIADIRSSWITFNPDQANPISWGHGPQTLAGAPYWNCGSGEAQEQIGGQAQHSETTTVTATVSVQQQIKLFDTINTSITASVSAGHAWTDSTTDTHSESKNVDPMNVAWINSVPATENVTGSVTMTGNAAQPINFANVTFSEPGRNQSGNPALDYAYVAHSRAMTQDEINTYCGGSGPDGSNHVVIGGTVGDITAGTTSPAGSGR